ncbi:MAG: ATP-binding protein [Isosphaeraceae bacterium]|nr:ATP-binding protein [Isosphaeraceae bacterium]
MFGRIEFWLLSALAGVAAWFFIAWLRRVLRTLDRLRIRLDAFEENRTSRPIVVQTGGPIGRLAQQIEAILPKIEARLEVLERDREQLRVVLGGMTEGVIAIDNRRRLLFANASADQFFGLDGSSVGRFLPELIRSTQIQQVVEATLSSSEIHKGEIAMVSREGLRAQTRTFAVHGTPLPGDPPTGAVFVFHDVTELRRLERMRQDFVANVSHELKTPLASIKAYTETLLDWALHDESVNVKFLHRIEEQAERLNQLILDLLSLARLDSGEGIFEHGPLELAPALEACAESHRGRAETKGLELQCDLEGLHGPTHVMADDEAIRQIFDNLIDNAIKYTPEGGWVRVGASLSGTSVAVEVADSGIGIPRDDLPRVFERFYRVDKARSRELGGTGLGLAIVKHLVQSIGGQITVTSRLGDGTRFIVLLPRHDPRASDSPEPRSH